MELPHSPRAEAVLSATNLPATELAYTNHAYVNPLVYEVLRRGTTTAEKAVRCEVKSLVFNITQDARIVKGSIGLNKFQRSSARISLNDPVQIQLWKPHMSLASITAGVVEVELCEVVRRQQSTASEESLGRDLVGTLENQVLTVGQLVPLRNSADGVPLQVTVKSIQPLALVGGGALSSRGDLRQGLVTSTTEFAMTAAESSNLTITSSKLQQKNLFRQDFNFEQLGVGGLDREFAEIFRRAFASRIYPPHIIKELGITHVRGMLLYGPPGTGKTLIARQIGQALRAREPKIVNGPEVLNKYVGQSEENIRLLFKDAEEEYKKKGDNSSLHIIIFDEIDAICKQRGAGPANAGVNDSIVNQLLSKIDGVDSLNNILLIGMTNRLDLIDEALLRPGRLEVHMEIGLPDCDGRLQILKIHTAKMREADRLARDVSLQSLAERTKNFSGAEIAGLIRSAASYAFARNVDFSNLGQPTDVANIQVVQDDFEQALEEVQPAFGVQDDDLKNAMLNGIIDYGSDFVKLRDSLITFAEQVKDGKKTTLMSVLLVGLPGAGKTALAASIARAAHFPFVKIVSPDNYVGFSEAAKVNSIKTVFEDAYKSSLSIIVLDALERLMDYTPLGMRFSNIVLQALLVLVKKVPKKEGHALYILATSSEPMFMEQTGICSAFQVVKKVPLLSHASHVKKVLQMISAPRNDFDDAEIEQSCRYLTQPLGIKRLIMVYEMASEICKLNHAINSEVFAECLNHIAS